MRFIPVSHFGGEGEFERFATSNVAVGTAQSGPLFGNTKFPEVGGVDIYPIESSLQKVVFVASGSEDTFAKDAYPYSQPFFTRILQPVDGASTYNFNAGSGGADRIINYVGTDFVSQSINVGTAAHNYEISCLRDPAPYYSGLTTGTSITESFEVGYNGFQDFAPSNRSYVIKFTARPSVIATGSIAYINYVDTNGNLQNYELIGDGSTVELECQTALHLDRGDEILNGVNLTQEILRPSTARTLSPYPYHGKTRKYRIETKFDAGTLAGAFTYMSGSNKYAQGLATKGVIHDVFATEIPMIRRCAMATVTDISDWQVLNLVSSSVTTSICTDSDTQEYYLGTTGSLTVGNTIYTDYPLTNPVTASYFKNPSDGYYVLTDGTGTITDEIPCNPGTAQYDIESGSQLIVSTNELTDLSGENNDASVFTADHFVSGTFGGQQTLEVNTPSTNSGSATITYTVPPLSSPTSTFSFLSAFYMNGNPVWSLNPAEVQHVVGDFDEDPGNNTYGYKFYGDSQGIEISAGSGTFVSLPSGSFNNPGWNILQYSLDNSTSPPTVNYNVNGVLSGSFDAENTSANIEEVKWNVNLDGSNPDSKLSNGSHFQVLRVSLDAVTTSSMDTLFNEYNRYGL